MPSSGDAVDVPPAAAAAARRYLRVERPVTAAVVVLVVALFLAAYLWLPLLQAVVVGVGLVALARAPLVRSRGTLRLTADADPEAVRAGFEGPTPPVLALQWGVADDVRRTDDGAIYEISYLFGLRSTTIETEARPSQARDRSDTAGEPGGEGSSVADLELVVTEGGTPWATYAVSVSERDDRTVVDVEVASDRRFGPRRLPQWLVAERYREEALEAQGYAVLERDAGLSL